MIRLFKHKIVFLTACFCLLSLATAAQEVPADYQDVLKSLDRKGDFKAGVLKVNIPCSDLKMTIQGVPTPTPFGFGGWIALTNGTQEDAVVAGDVAMLETEVTPVLKALRKNGLDVVAIHHHMTGERPVVIFLHYWGRGPAEKLATDFKEALDELGRRGAAHGSH